MTDSDALEPAETSLSPTFTIQGPKELEKGWTECMAWFSDGRVVTGSDDSTLRIWNLTTGTQEGSSMVHEGRVRGVIATEDGRIISCAPRDKRLKVWNMDTDELTDGPWSTEEYGFAWWMALSQNEELLASCHSKGIVIWEMAGTMRIRNFINLDFIVGHRHLHSACFSPDGDKLAIAYESWILVLDAASGEIIFGPSNVASSSRLYAVVWSSEQSDRLFCASRDGRILSFDSSTGKIIDELKQSHRDIVMCLSLSPDGKSLASGSDDGTVRLWGVESRLPVGGPLNHGSDVWAVAFSRSGEFVACSGYGGNISVWRVPWWDNNNRKTPDPLLDQSAVISPDVPSNIVRESEFDFLDAPASRRPRPLQDHSRVNPSNPPPRVQRRMLSWRLWNMIPRFVLDRSHPTRIYMGWAEPRTHVASRSTISNDPSTPSDSAPTPPPVIVEESVSGESSEESENDSITEPEVSQIGCCGFLSRRRPRATAARERENIPVEQSLPRNSPPEASNAGIPNHPPSRPAVQDILELSAVVQSSDTS